MTIPSAASPRTGRRGGAVSGRQAFFGEIIVEDGTAGPQEEDKGGCARAAQQADPGLPLLTDLKGDAPYEHREENRISSRVALKVQRDGSEC